MKNNQFKIGDIVYSDLIKHNGFIVHIDADGWYLVDFEMSGWNKGHNGMDRLKGNTGYYLRGEDLTLINEFNASNDKIVSLIIK